MPKKKRSELLFVLTILLALFIPLALSEEPTIKTFVNDYANILNDSDEQQLSGLLNQLYSSNTAEFSVVTIKSLEGKSIEAYSLELAQEKLGDKEKNNGLLLLISVDDRAYRFEVGRGLEGDLNDAKIGRIGRTYLVPNFRSGDYSKGVLEAS